MKKKIAALVMTYLLTLGLLVGAGLLVLERIEPPSEEFHQEEIILEGVTLEEITP